MRVCLIAGVVACWALAGGGCGMDSASRVAMYETQLARVETLLVAHGGKIEGLSQTLDKGLDLLADVNLPAGTRESVLAGVEATQKALLAAVEYRAKLETWIDETQTAIATAKSGTMDVSAELKVIGESVGAAGTAVGGTVGAVVGLVGLLVSLLGNVIQRAKAKTTKTTLAAIVNGVESAEASAAAVVKAAVEAKMKAAGVYDAGDALVDSVKV